MSTDERVRTLSIVLGGVLLGWLAKLGMLAAALWFAVSYPLRDPLFPAPLRGPVLLALGIGAPLAVALWALSSRRLHALGVCLGVSAAASLLLLLHQATYNDASFLTALWSSLYGLWMFSRLRAGDDDLRLAPHASLLARLIVALMFLGGFVGKLTPGYWDGSALYEIYFVDRAYWSFDLARALWPGDALRTVALVYSRMVVCSEGLLVTLPLWPERPALWTALLAMGAMIALNNLLLVSVLGPLMGVCLAALRCGARERPTARSTF